MVMRVSFEMAGLSTIDHPAAAAGRDGRGRRSRPRRPAGSPRSRRSGWRAGCRGLLLVVCWAGGSGRRSARRPAGSRDGPLDVQVAALAGGLGSLVLVGLAWLAVRALAPPTESLPDRDTIESTATRLALPVVLSYTVTVALVVVLSGLALALAVVGLFVRPLLPLQELMLQVIGQISNDEAQWLLHVVVDVGALAVGSPAGATRAAGRRALPGHPRPAGPEGAPLVGRLSPGDPLDRPGPGTAQTSGGCCSSPGWPSTGWPAAS